jgi:hypothetical protein
LSKLSVLWKPYFAVPAFPCFVVMRTTPCPARAVDGAGGRTLQDLDASDVGRIEVDGAVICAVPRSHPR